MESLKNFVSFGLHCLVGRCIDRMRELTHFKHSDVHAECAGKQGWIKIHIQHAFVGMTEMPKNGASITAQNTGNLAPLKDITLKIAIKPALPEVLPKVDANRGLQASGLSIVGFGHLAWATIGCLLIQLQTLKIIVFLVPNDNHRGRARQEALHIAPGCHISC